MHLRNWQEAYDELSYKRVCDGSVGRTHEVFGDPGVLWLVRPNQVLDTTPLDLISQGKIDPVLRLLIQIEHGIYP
jgi:hypothetical protein